MILSRSKKFIFFRVAKTGSTTAEVMLRMCGAFDLTQDTMTGTREWELPTINRIPRRYPDNGLFNWAHATPDDLIRLGVLTLEELREYRCFAYLRPVASRFVSGYMHCMRTGVWGRHGMAGYQPEQFMAQWRENHEKFSAWEIIGRDQVDWFFVDGEQVVTPLDFGNYEAELRKAIDLVGGYDFAEIPRLNRAHQEREAITARRDWAKAIWDTQPEIRAEVLARYGNDMRFYEESFCENDGRSQLHQYG